MSWTSAKALATPPAQIVFDVTNHPTRIHVVEALRGKSGFLTLTRLVVDSYEREEYLLFSGFDESGASLDQETMEKLFGCAGRVDGGDPLPEAVFQREVLRMLRKHGGIFPVKRKVLADKDSQLCAAYIYEQQTGGDACNRDSGSLWLCIISPHLTTGRMGRYRPVHGQLAQRESSHASRSASRFQRGVGVGRKTPSAFSRARRFVSRLACA